jgi:two-component system response regulator NreC
VNVIRVFLADDHTIMRRGLRVLLEAEKDIEVVGEAEDGREAVERIIADRPDVVLMDISMPSLNGLEATAKIKNVCPDVHVLILTMHDNEEYVHRILQVGASGYILKQAAETELLVAIRSVHKGQRFLSPSISERFVEAYLQRHQDGEDGGFAILTSREREILQLLAEGKTNKEIAALLGISVKTVDTHRTHLMEKLQAHSGAQLVLHAVRRGLVR